MPNETGQHARETSAAEREANPEFVKFDPRYNKASLGKGEKIDAEAELKKGVITLDTGALDTIFDKFKDEKVPEDKAGRDAFIKKVLGETVKYGDIDHHSADIFFSARGLHPDICATEMVFKFQTAIKEILENIKKEGGTATTNCHADSDMDAISASYLMKSLMDHGNVPTIAEDLAKLASSVDYGKYSEVNPEAYLDAKVYIETLPGTIASIKDAIDKERGAELGAKVFGNPAMKQPNGRLTKEGVSLLEATYTRFENEQNKAVFEVLNALNAHKQSHPDFNFSKSISAIEEGYSPELRRILALGRPITEEKFAKLFEAHKEAVNNPEHYYDAKIPGQDGQPKDAKVLLYDFDDPLTATNLTYSMEKPNTIVVVFAGKEHKGGDYYDIGIVPDQAKEFDMRGLCLAINKAEKAKRDAIYAKADADRTPEEQALVKNWDSQPPRDVFDKGRIADAIQKGWAQQSDIIDKDPTPLVSGGSLIPASRTSLLTKEEFFAAVNDYFKKQME